MPRCNSPRILSRLMGMAVLGALGISCEKGKEYYPVHGKVLVDGKPAAGALVVLHPEDDASLRALRPSAVVEADGSFTVRSYDPKVCPTPRDGAPAGEYLIAINWFQQGVERRESVPDKLHNRYGNSKTSGLRATVKEEPNQLTVFELTARKN